jgi:hypothetical protein
LHGSCGLHQGLLVRASKLLHATMFAEDT